MNHKHFLSRVFKIIGLILTLGMSMSGCATSTFTWKEEVLLHDGKRIIVKRSDIYDSSMRHEIGQGAPLAEHQTTFVIPDINQTVTWKSDNRSFPNPENLNLLALDFIASVPYVATTIGGSIAYNKWGRPNPPYVFFRHDGKAWRRISLEEFPEKFKINLIVTGRKKDNSKISEAIREFGFVPAQTVEEINREPGRGKESYAILRIPIDYGPPRPVYSGPQAPHPIPPPNSADGKK